MSRDCRVLASPPGRPVPRHRIDWLVGHQGNHRLILPPSLSEDADQPARLRHAPFEAAAPEYASLARLLAGPLGAAGFAMWAAEAAVLALLEGAAVLVPRADLFSELIPLSAWSMNVPETPDDRRLVRHAAIAAGLPAAFMEGAPAALEALLSGDAARCDRMRRDRRRLARADGPSRFRGIAAKSAGRRPAVVYLDLLPALAAAPGSTARPAPLDPTDAPTGLAALDRPMAVRLLSMAGALFV